MGRSSRAQRRVTRWHALGATWLVAACSSPAAPDAGDVADDGLDGTTPADTGDPVDTVPLDGMSDAAAPPCGTDPWITYGHDARRTFATDACIPGNVRMLWRYVPTPVAGQRVRRVFRAIAQRDAVFLQWAGSRDPYPGTTAADRIDASGVRVWTFDSGTDANFGYWPTLAFGRVILDDDGIFYLDSATGTRTHRTGVDYWGQIAPGTDRIYVSNVLQADGPGIFVGSYNAMLQLGWSANLYMRCGTNPSDVAGGLAVDGGTVFYAPNYRFTGVAPAPLETGVYAFDAASGLRRWFRSHIPTSSISASDGLAYFVEASMRLVAIRQSDGTEVWAQMVENPSVQAPVLADGLTIVATLGGVFAFRAGTGAMAWSNPAVTVNPFGSTGVINNGCAGGTYPVQQTAVAAASASRTLVVTTPQGISVLSTADGRVVGTLAMPGLRDPVLVGNRVYAMDAMGVVAMEAE